MKPGCNRYFAGHPEAMEVLEFIRAHPEGVDSSIIAKAFPELDQSARTKITCKLKGLGLIRRRTSNSRYSSIWEVIR